MPPELETDDDSMAETTTTTSRRNSSSVSGQKQCPTTSATAIGTAKISIHSDTLLSVANLHNIPKQYLNGLGFIDYNHVGDFPWNNSDDSHKIKLNKKYTSWTDILAIDCEMVGIGELQDSELGRVSIINEYGYCVYDTFAKPECQVTGYRSKKSGIYPENLENAPSVKKVVEEVAILVRDKVLIGHSIHNDLAVLRLQDHREIRDTAEFYKNKLGRSRTPSLKELTEKYLKLKIQVAEHSSIQDAQATLKLYLLYREEWEEELEEKRTLANLPSPKDTSMTMPPTSINLMHVSPRDTDLNVESNTVFVRPNKITGAYESSQEYLDFHFRLLLEDFLRPLRHGVKTVRTKGHKSVKIDSLFYNVQIEGTGSSTAATEFEVKKNGALLIPVVRNNLVDVDWEQSKIFMNGSLLVITPDDFKSVKFAEVVNRPKDSSKVSSFVRIHVKFCREGASWVVNQSNNQFLVLESKAFYEAYRHTLEYLQVMQLDRFPLKKYIVDAVTLPHPTKCLTQLNQKLRLDFKAFTGPTFHPRRYALALDFPNWPTATDLNFDPSQYEAFQKALTQEVSIIQGPPGTGKTFIGIQIVKLLLTNPCMLSSGPILVVAYTNHALDQTLEQIHKFITDYFCEGNKLQSQAMVLRIGGGSKSDIIQPLTLRHKEKMNFAKKKIQKSLVYISSFLPLISFININKLVLLNPGILDFMRLPKEIITRLEKSAGAVWRNWKRIQVGINGNPRLWFGIQDLQLQKKKNSKTKTRQPNLFIVESPDLFAKIYTHHPNFFANAAGGLDAQLKSLHPTVDNKGVTELTFLTRWSFYFCLLRHLTLVIESIKLDHCRMVEELSQLSHYLPMGESMKQVKVVGMTTTGAVKYKNNVVLKFKPKVMLVEEAAHVLEAHVVASLTEHCQQMIMIGDHKQLRPLTADYELSNKYYLDVSLMERMVRNGIDQGTKNWVQLKVQHRMRPEIARMVCPVIYTELDNHPDVEIYPSVKGCLKNLFFINHTQLEARAKGSSSTYNNHEVNIVENLINHFIGRGFYERSQVTVIVTYLAQKTLIEKKLKKYLVVDDPIKISTVDGHQGEENDIIILSLVRSNPENRVGFLQIDNRVCVALSRARHGLFIIGNMDCLKSASDTWDTINETLIEMDCIGKNAPLIKPPTVPMLPNLGGNELGKTEITIQTVPGVIPNCNMEKKVARSISSKPRQCNRVFNCGHRCRFTCGEKNYFKSGKHKNYKCLERCRRSCPRGSHPCPGDHECYTHCKVHVGTGCMVNVPFRCIHGSMVVECWKLSLLNSRKGTSACPKCEEEKLDRQQVLLMIQSLADMRI